MTIALETFLGPLQRALLDSLRRLDPQADASVLVAAALCCQALVDGDVCLPLARHAGRPAWPDAEGSPCLPTLAQWLARLRASPLVGAPGDFAPLRLDGERLYLARYHAYECQLAEQLRIRAAARPAVDAARLADSLARLFAGNRQSPDWQRLAAAQAVRRQLAVISGGPGTGKTTTVVRLLAALLEQGEPLAIGLAAPTGKAAARMAEAIRAAKAQLPVSQAVQDALPEQARTLHRLLGSRGDRPAVRHHAGNPLALDVLVVDEASMVDLALMAKLLDALPPAARLILLGDKDQLAAVEAGAVFAELCEGRGFDARAAAELRRLTGQPVPVETPRSVLGDAVLLLSHSHRFAGDSGIGELARRVNGGDLQGTLGVLREGRADLAWNAAPTPEALLERLEQGYRAYLEAAAQGAAQAAFAAFAGFRALVAQHQGPYGVERLNELLEARFRRRLGVPAGERWYAGRALMVRHNDYALGLFNGDIGLCLPTPDGLRILFEGEQGYRSFSPARLPRHDSAFVMTVHKSQGSEFGEVLLALPEQPSPLLTRALLYTGITRARRRVELWGLPARLAEALARRAERAAGLAARLALAEPPAADQLQLL